MATPFLLILLLLQTAVPASLYHLTCSHNGQTVPCVVCMACGSANVDHFSLQDTNGKVQFAMDAPPNKTFSSVNADPFPVGSEPVYEIGTIQETGDSAPLAVSYFFESKPSGLIRLHPAVSGPHGEALGAGWSALSYQLDARYFQFSVLLGFDLTRERIVLLPKQPSFTAYGPQTPRRLSATGRLELYSTHNKDSSHSTVKIASGEIMNFYQAHPASFKKPTGVVVIDAWAPAFMAPLRGDAPDVEALDFDRGNLWLELKVDGRIGWIRGDSSFRAIGLTPQNGRAPLPLASPASHRLQHL